MAHKSGSWSPEHDELLELICSAQSSIGPLAVVKLCLYALRALFQAQWFAAKLFLQAGVANVLQGVLAWSSPVADQAFLGTMGAPAKVIPGGMYCPATVRA